MDNKPAIIVIFGITGDLSRRKLLPALYHLFKDDLLDEHTVVLGITRRSVTADDMLEQVDVCVNELEGICDPVAMGKIKKALRMHTMDQTAPDEYQKLKQLLNDIETEQGMCMNRLYYLSIPPQMFGPIVRNLGEQGLNQSCQHGTAGSRLLVEKPFGYDLVSARELITETGRHFSEDQLFRIDHYLAKDTVRNIIAFRQMTPKLREIWCNKYISDITITAYEKIDIEGRATFYEQVGALRDFIQSHLLQLLAVVTMELPESMESEAVHKTRLQLLQAIEPVAAQNVAAQTLRGQYQGYKAEVNNPHAYTETFARVRTSIENDRWRGAAMTMQTGKAMAEKRTDVRVTFSSPHGGGYLLFSIQPDTGISLHSDTQAPPAFFAELEPAIQAFNGAHPPSPTAHPDAYERVLLDAVRGDHTLFTTSEEVVAAWEVVNDVVEAWSRSGEGLVVYDKGSADVGT